MSGSGNSEITQILHEWAEGDESAGDRLLPFVYHELKHRAKYLMAGERSNHTLQPTALVHEAFVKLTGLDRIQWADRRHFFRFVSQIMRQILVDHARVRATEKRGNRPIHFSLEDLQIPAEERASAVVRLDDALTELAKMDETQARIVEMRYFGGLTFGEIATTLDISERTVGRKWKEARLWLYHEINAQ